MLNGYMGQSGHDQFLGIYDCAEISGLRGETCEPAPAQAERPAVGSVLRYFFFKELAEKAKSVIEPAMRKTSRALQKLGHGSAIFREMEATIVNDSMRPAHISFVIFTETRKPAYDLSRYPHIAFMASSQKNTVWVRKRVGSQDNKAGEYQVNEITGKLVEHHIREFMSEVLAGDRAVSGL